MPLRTNQIIPHRHHNHKHEDNNRPVHIDRRRHGRNGEETHYKRHGQERKCRIIDRGAVFAQGPAAREEGFVAEALEADTANGGHVGEYEGSVGEGDDCVEGDVRAEIEGADEEGEEEGDHDGVEGDVPAWSDLDSSLEFGASV